MFWLPFFLVNRLRFDLTRSGYVSSLYELAGVGGALLAGYISDRYMQSRRAPVSAIMMAGFGVIVLLPILSALRAGVDGDRDFPGGGSHLWAGYTALGRGFPGYRRRDFHGNFYGIHRRHRAPGVPAFAVSCDLRQRALWVESGIRSLLLCGISCRRLAGSPLEAEACGLRERVTTEESTRRQNLEDRGWLMS